MQPNWLMQRSYLTPNRMGLSFGEESWTFAQLAKQAEIIAGQLASSGFQAGDRVALLAPSTPALIHVIYGCMQLQLEVVLLNARLTQKELTYQIEDAQVKGILVAESEASKVAQHTYMTFEQLVVQPVAKIVLATEWEEQQTISIMYTSGTTGFPKGVRQTVQNHSSSAISSVLNLGLSERDTWLCIVPIFHISGFSILMRSLLYGMPVRLYEKFDAAVCATEIANGTVTRLSAVSAVLERLLTYMETHSIRAHDDFSGILLGGGPVPIDYLKRAAQLHLQVAQTYGMTETSSQTATLRNEDALRKLGSAGKPLFFNQIKIDGAEMARTEGEICIKGPHVTPGYVGRFQQLSPLEDGWLKTGDIGYLDEEGYLYVIDRRSDLIISGGENIYPAEIENVLLMHPLVQEAGVCGIEDAVWGQVPVAYIVAKEQITVENILNFCEMNLAHYKIPKIVKFVEELPRNGANKLLRRKLKYL